MGSEFFTSLLNEVKMFPSVEFEKYEKTLQKDSGLIGLTKYSIVERWNKIATIRVYSFSAAIFTLMLLAVSIKDFLNLHNTKAIIIGILVKTLPVLIIIAFAYYKAFKYLCTTSNGRRFMLIGSVCCILLSIIFLFGLFL